MAVYGRLLREKAFRDHEDAMHERAMKRDRDMVAVPFERLTKQTAKAVLFPTYGWVPAVALRWRRADGSIVPWTVGRESDTLLIAREFVPSAKTEG